MGNVIAATIVLDHEPEGEVDYDNAEGKRKQRRSENFASSAFWHSVILLFLSIVETG